MSALTCENARKADRHGSIGLRANVVVSCGYGRIAAGRSSTHW